MLLLSILLFAFAAVVPWTAAATSVSEVLLTQALLFGDLDKDCTPNATVTCSPSVVDAATMVRAIKAGGTPVAFLPTLDRSHILTKLHPKDWGANFAMHTQLGQARAMISPLGFTTDATLATYSIKEEDARLLESFEFPVTHNMRDVTTTRLIDAATGLHLVAARRRFDALDSTAKVAANTIHLSNLFRENQGGYKNTMVLVSDDTVEAFDEAITKHGERPEIICRLFAPSDSVELKNGTWLVNVKTTKTHLHRIQIHRLSSTSSTIVNVTLTAQTIGLSVAMRTEAQYVADRAMMKAQAMIAASNNPVQGSMAGPMPAATAPDGAALCRRGECPMGNLWADAIRDATGTDVALFSGAWAKGPGWAAGNVTLRDVYNSYGFIEMTASNTVLGLSLFELWNHSLAASAFDPYLPTSQSGARHLPQVSGMRVKYNLARADVNNRLISIEVWDKEHNEYRPLDRLKKYTVSGPQYLMQNSAVHSKYMKAAFAGEGPLVPISKDVQHFLRVFLQTKPEYVPGIFGRIIEDNTSTTDMMAWNHANSECPANTVMNVSIKTCVACPTGMERAAGASKCTVIPAPSSLSGTALVAIVGGAAVAAIIIALVAVIALMRWRRYKRTRYCPKDPSAPIAAFFVTVRNEVAVRERYPLTASDAFKRIEEAVIQAASENQCFVARRLGAHFLVVSADPAAAVRAAASVQRAVDLTVWRHLLTDSKATVIDKRRPSDAKTGTRVPLSSRRYTGQHRSSAQAASMKEMGSSDRAGSVKGTTVMEMSASSRSGLGTSRSQTSGRSSDAHRDVTPLVSAGLAFGTVTIDHDEEFDAWTYSGAVVDAAATVADAARPGQFLATETITTVVKGQAVSADFDEFATRTFVCPVAKVNKPVVLYQMDASGCPRRHFEDASSGDSDTAGALTAALEVAAGGLTSRTVGAVCWSLPSLRSSSAFNSRADHAKQIEAVLSALTEVCIASQADLSYAVDGSFVAVVNGAAARTAQVATTTTTLARAGVLAVQGSTDVPVVAGVATAPAMAGILNKTVIVSGVAVERARLLSSIALNAASTTAGAANVLVSCNILGELEPHYVLAGINAIVWPDHCVGSKKGSNHGGICIYAVIDEKKTTEDEWLYQLAAASKSNPYAKGNTLLRDAVMGEFSRGSAGTPPHPELSEEGGPTYPPIEISSLLFDLEAAAVTPASSPTTSIASGTSASRKERIVKHLSARTCELSATFNHQTL